MKESIKKISEDISEVVKERIFSPMYFYFILAWVITNWKFTYTFFFTDENVIFEKKEVLKMDFLLNLYHWSSFSEILWSISKLLIIPAISAFVAVWFLSKLSEKFYKKNEEHKQNKRVIKKELEYEAKVRFFRSEREIRDLESDKNRIKYEDQGGFNEKFDENRENIEINNSSFLPSKVLYENDYESYKEGLNQYNQHLENMADDYGDEHRESMKDELRDEIIDEYREDLKGEAEYESERDRD